MKFELLPNEIIINCFDYLNAPDLFNAFDGLNYRFQRLITNIPLTLNFQHVKKTTFDQFCKKMLSNPQIKNQIYSLQLSSAHDTSGQINAFLSLFSLEEFPHLRSLTLIRLKENETKRLESMLPSLSNLCYFRDDSQHKKNTILSTLPLLNLRKLDVPEYSTCTLLTQTPLLITHLTVYSCELDDLNKFFQYASMLKYLKVENLQRDNNPASYQLNLTNPVAASLTQLNLRTYYVAFNHIEMILNQTPNLKILTLYNNSFNDDIIDANRWEKLISSALPYLYIFRFHFTLLFIRERKITWHTDGGFDKWKQYENDFWIKQHHWYTAYELKNRGITIFTVPYCEDYYEAISDTDLYCNHSLIDQSKLFDNVTRLIFSLNEKLQNSDLKFSNIQSLILQTKYTYHRCFMNSLSVKVPIQVLKNNVNLSKLKDLRLGHSCEMESTSIFLLEIFKEAPHFSSISIYVKNLLALLNNGELCKHFNKMITKLELHQEQRVEFIPFDQLKEVWKIFSNVEELTCRISGLQNVVELLNRLPKLSNLYVSSSTFYNAKNTEVLLRSTLPDLDANFELDSEKQFCERHIDLEKQSETNEDEQKSKNWKNKKKNQ